MIATMQQEQDFRGEVRRWLTANFPRCLSIDPGIAEPATDAERETAAASWKAAMAATGWGVPTWPEEYGGGGLDADEAAILRQEMRSLGAESPIGGMGVMMFGPTLLEYGDEAQKHEHLPPIARGEIKWCQGFSEPGAGSDLASLSTRAEDRGDHFLINGQKIWTSGADTADWCFCLVRTDISRKHDGISFIMIDMRSPGVEVRPILLTNGLSPFCETFFTDVAVPKDNLVGPINGGWTIAKRLLQHERSGLAASVQAKQESGLSLPEIARRYVGVDDRGRIADLDLRSRLAQFQIDLRCFQLTSARVASEGARAGGAGGTASILKQAGWFLRRDSAEFVTEIMGWRGLGWEGAPFTEEELTHMRNTFYSKAGGIAGGSQEVQYNIIAKRVLGLPDSNAAR